MMNQITAPYGFVPLASKVLFPEWVQPIKGPKGLVAPPIHDVPYADGLRGTLELEVYAETPIFTRAAGGNGDLPYKLPDGRYAIPGTAVRGMLRNVVEIVTFSRFRRVNNHRYAVRDLQNRQLYGKYMAEIVRDPKTGQQEPTPLVNAGWLRREGEGDSVRHFIEVCDFAKIEYRALMQLAEEKGIRGFQPGIKQSSIDKYMRWGKELDAKVSVSWRVRPKENRIISQYGVVSLQPPTVTGKLVFTGQPSQWRPDVTGAGNAKHHDFLFVDGASPTRLELSREAFEDFEFAHSDRGQQNRLGSSQTPNTEWAFWEKKLAQGQRVPVFFLTDDRGRTVKSFGLAMMFRLSYLNSIHQAIGHRSPDHLGSLDRIDFAEGLFGIVRDSSQDGISLALKGRIGISHAIQTSSNEPQAKIDVILGSPKASYYPNYVEQSASNGRGSSYKTWMDVDCVPRGWKRYRALTETWIPKPPTGGDGRALDPTNVGTSFRPLPAGTTFRALVDLHNVKPVELGALLWAVSFGDDPNARHTLGMARPLGYGRVRLSVANSAIIDMDGQPVALEPLKGAFEAYMVKELPGWKNSPQIQELLALARPVKPSEACYQRLDPGARVNEFADAKRQFLSLPMASNTPPASGTRPPIGGKAQSVTTTPRSISGPITPRPAGREWPGRKKDDIVEVELTGLNKREKWRCTVLGYPRTVGTLSGKPPADAKAGQRYKVIVDVANDPSAIQLRWPASCS